MPTCDAVINHGAAAAIVIPARANAVEPINERPCGQRDQPIAASNRGGRMKWRVSDGCGKRSLVDNRAPSSARSMPGQQTEAVIICAVRNRMHDCARPKIAIMDASAK
jgi:hypothetical protein